MKVLTHRNRVVGRSSQRLEAGYIEKADYHENLFVRETLFLGFVVHREILDREHVPIHAVISNNCLGDTGGFVSKFAPFDKSGQLIEP